MRSVSLFVLLLTAAVPAQSGERISQADFKKLFAAGAVSIVDTRSESEFARGHIPGAVPLPGDEASAGTRAARRIVAQLKSARRPVVVYCACPAEGTSLAVARRLAAEGLDARALTGGWVDWFNDGNPVEPRGK